MLNSPWRAQHAAPGGSSPADMPGSGDARPLSMPALLTARLGTEESHAAHTVRARNRVLVIDDDPVIRRLFHRVLESADFDVVMADGGAEGLDRLQKDNAIGLVLLDLTMPGMDGWRFRHAQRADDVLRRIPTVIVTGTPLTQIVHADLGADDYLLKPVGREHLLSVVAHFCKPKDPDDAL